MKRIKHDTIDIYTNTGVEAKDFNDLLNVIVFAENEYGNAPTLLFRSIFNDSEPSAYVSSHLLAELGFNSAPNMDEIGWELHLHEATQSVWVRITGWPTTSLFPPDQSRGNWIYTYPVVRDLLDWLKNPTGNEINKGIGCTYVTSSTLHDALESDEYPILSPSDVYHYNLMTEAIYKYTDPALKPKRIKKDELRLFLTPPTWMFPKLALMQQYVAPSIVVVGHADESVDVVAGASLMEYFAGYQPDNGFFDAAVVELTDQIAKHKKAKSDFLQAMSDAEPQPNNMLWG
jgi:hypothetical protein